MVVRSVKTDEERAEYLPVGHATSLAARMQALAPTGSIAITGTTRKLVEGYFSLKALGPTRVKGVSDTVEVFEVVGLGPLRTRLQRAEARGLTKFVGREREMVSLRHAADQAKSGHGQIVAAMAEVGVGKSRLFYEFKVTSQRGWMVLETFSVSHRKASAYLPVIDLLHGYFEIKSEDDQRKRREKDTGRVLALDRALEDTLPYLFALLGLVEGEDPLAQMDAQMTKRRTLDAIKRLLLRESLNQPLMVIFEDLHWIDDETQALLSLLADSIGTSRMLLLVNYRPEYSHQWGSKTYYTQLRLDPLGKESAEEMLSALLGSTAPSPSPSPATKRASGQTDAVDRPLATSPAPATASQGASRERSSGDMEVARRVRVPEPDSLSSLKRLIIERTEGNPFFMEETVQVLLDEGALVRDGMVKLAKPLGELKIPPTVQAILAARIDRLPPAEKDLLQTLAAIGKEFPLSLVRAVVGTSADELGRMLDDLQLAEFIYEQPAVGDIEYTFKHALTLEVAYGSVLTDLRKLLHEKLGQALEGLYRDNLEEHFNELAYHYGRSPNLAKAARYARMAGQRAYFRSHYPDAVRYLMQAEEILSKLPEGLERDRQEVPVQLLLGQCQFTREGAASLGAQKAWGRALELAERVGDPASIFRALLCMRVSAHASSGARQAHDYSQRLIQMAERLNDPVMLSEACSWHGLTLMGAGDLTGAESVIERGLVVRDQLPANVRFYFDDPRRRAQTTLARLLWLLGFAEKAVNCCEQALALPSLNPFEMTETLLNAAGLNRCVRNLQRIRDLTDETIKFSTQYGFSSNLERAAAIHGWALAQSEDQFEQGLSEMSRNQGTVTTMLAEENRLYLGELYGCAGKTDEGLRIIDQVAATSPLWLLSEAYRLKAELLLTRDPSATEEAESWLKRAVAGARDCGAKSYQLRAATSLARLLAKQGKRDEARVALAEIYGWFTEGFDTADLKDAKSLLDQLS